MAHLPRRIIDERRAAVAQRPSMMLCHSGKDRREISLFERHPRTMFDILAIVRGMLGRPR
jgi:hypothetical protein